MNRHLATALSLIAAAPLFAPALASAAETSSGFHFRLAPIVIEGSTFHESTDSAKFEEYRDLTPGLSVRLLSLDGLSADRRQKVDFQVKNGGKLDGFYGLRYDVAGNWRLDLAYNMIPHRFGNDGHLLYTHTAPGVWSIPDPVQQALQGFAVDNQPTLNFGTLSGALAPYLATANSYDVGLERRRMRAELRLGDFGAGRWNVEFAHESRDGLRPIGTSFGFSNVTETAEPVRYDTSDATLSGVWNWSHGLMTAGYRYSKFKNDVSTLVWDNPFRAVDSTSASAYTAPGTGSVDGPSQGRLDLAPDNNADTLFTHGRFDFGGSSWFDFGANWTRNQQDDPLLPYTTNTAIDVATGAPFAAADRSNLPYSTARREAKQTNFTAEYGTRFGSGWQAGVRYVYLDYNDNSPRFVFPGYVRFDAVWEDTPRITVGYGWTRKTLTADVDKDFGKLGRIGLEARNETVDRDFRETSKTTENVVGATWDAHLDDAMVRAKYEHGRRDFSGDYMAEAEDATFVLPQPLANQPALRRFDQAERTLDRWRVNATLPLASVWTVGAHLDGYRYDYDRSTFGLTGDRDVRYGVDIDRTLGAIGSCSLFAERSNRKVSQAARQSGATLSTNPADSWFADLHELNDVFGLSWSHDHQRYHGKLTGSWERSDGKADLSSPPGGTPNLAVGFGNYDDYKLWSLEGTLDYDVTPAAAVGLHLLYEDYTLDTFTQQGLANYLPGALLLNASDGSFRGWTAGLRLKLTLGT